MGLRRIGVEIAERRAPENLKFWARYPLLILKRSRFSKRPVNGPPYFFVPEFRQKDVPLARFLALLGGRKVIFDPLAARYETKIVDWRRKPADSPSAWWNKKIDDAAFRLAGLILADTAAHGEYYARMYGLDPAKIAVLPLGYNDEIFEKRGAAQSNDPETFSVLFFGSFLPLHGADVIVEAARFVAAADPRIRFVMLGEGQTLPAANAAADAAGLRNIAFLGRRPVRVLPSAIAAADLCLGIFGRTEKARRVVPHKIFQSMAMGKAVVTARTPAVEEFFADRKNIILCDEPLAESLAAAILTLKHDRAMRDRLAKNGYDLVRRDFSPEAVARRLVDIVERHFGRFEDPRSL